MPQICINESAILDCILSTYCCIFILSFSFPVNDKLVSFFIFLHNNYSFLIEKQTEKWTKKILLLSSSVSQPQVVPKKSGVTTVKNEKGEELSTRLTTGLRVCIDYRRLNEVTRKDHFPLPFIDQLLKRVSGHPFYCFLDGCSGYLKIEIAPEDQEKTTFTCPFGTYVYRRMPFGHCNAPATFQRCMLSMLSDMVECIMEVYMDDITIYGGDFEECMTNLEAILERCIEKNLVPN